MYDRDLEEPEYKDYDDGSQFDAMDEWKRRDLEDETIEKKAEKVLMSLTVACNLLNNSKSKISQMLAELRGDIQ